MFRTAVLRSARYAAQAGARTQRPAIRQALASPFLSTRIPSPAVSISAARCYSSAAGLGQEEVTGRILDLLKNFDKVSAWCTGWVGGQMTDGGVAGDGSGKGMGVAWC